MASIRSQLLKIRSKRLTYEHNIAEIDRIKRENSLQEDIDIFDETVVDNFENLRRCLKSGKKRCAIDVPLKCKRVTEILVKDLIGDDKITKENTTKSLHGLYYKHTSPYNMAPFGEDNPCRVYVSLDPFKPWW